jgi:hypothetical protein
MLQVIEAPGGVAESCDGLNWKLYVADEAIVSHTGLSEIQYGSWSLQEGSRRSRVRGTCASRFIEEAGERLIAALELWAARVPFPARDFHELWLLDGDAGAPLALLESALEPPARGSVDDPRWHPGAAAKTEFVSRYGDAGTLVDLLSRAAGRRPRGIWVERGPRGDARTENGERMPSSRFPPLFLRSEWDAPEEAGLLRDFLAWQSPWLLQLAGLDAATRCWLESAAWSRPAVTDRVFRLYPLVLDRDGLRVARVKARLVGNAIAPEAPSEPFYPFYIE